MKKSYKNPQAEVIDLFPENRIAINLGSNDADPDAVVLSVEMDYGDDGDEGTGYWQ